MSKTIKSTTTREAWLLQAVALQTPLFTELGYKVPAIKVSCGWPSARGCSRKKIAIGECWDKSAASDRVAQIFISPRLKEVDTPQGVLSTLIHEVVHAVVGNKEGHNKVFGKCARGIGLEGKLTQTHCGEELRAKLTAMAKKLGEYPHATLNPSGRPTKKQTTRLVKCECGTCGYNVRVTRKWLDIGAPICPCNKKTMGFEIPDELEGGDEE